MNPLFRQQESGTKTPGGLFAILHWLARLTRYMQLTEEEQDAAGIYFVSQYDHDDQD